ncbi:hypothetical protein TorRG33x02_309840 [Trema orientale]|uniref:Uncharacterized protein n=1 Tax=Trema orientale TaxID=63057 RepID=A0A2P5BTF8_TREOI|nr:hypothetical protein TorRG33x02_309840 [Trema orientale]
MMLHPLQPPPSHFTIVSLSHVVVNRPFSPNLAQDRISGQDNGLLVSTKGHASGFEHSGAIEVVLVNTNQDSFWIL